jgi:tetratricopeptide (TPR) repeat protein
MEGDMASRSLKGQVAQLRRNMREVGRTWRDIARVIKERYRVAPMVAFRLAHGWTQEEVADRYNAAWPSEHPKTGNQISYWENWRLDAPSGSTARMPSYRDLDRLAQLYECAVADLLDAPDYGERDPNAVTPEAASGHNETRISSELMLEEGDRTNRRDALKLGLIGAAVPEVVRGVLTDAADEAMEFTRLSGASGVGAGTLNHLHAVIVDLDQAFYTQPLPQVFTVARAYRRRVQELIQGRHTLAEGRELYVYAGWLDEHLAWVARNLDDPRAAEAYAIDCYEHANQAGHAELCGYAAQVMASVPMDADQPERAVDAIRKGVAKTTSPSHVGVWVRAHAAEIHARLGQRDESAEMLRQAKELYDRLPPRVMRRFNSVNSLLTEYDMLGYAARADAWLRNDDAAKRHGEQALAAFQAATDENPLPGKDSGVRLDLALTVARLGSPEEAIELGNQALAFTERFRMEMPRARRLDRALTSQYPDLTEVQEFHERYRTLSQAA